ncbi:MAG: D-glycero-beta-D-manno-heptose-7-phosphate kinase [Syntrophobacteraceae bacterium]
MPPLLQFSPEEKQRLTEAASRFKESRIMVVGDLMLDIFIWGEVDRISPEAPVPVVQVREETKLLGGTANVVNNVAALGGKVMVTGVIGDDPGGRELVDLLRQASVPADGLFVEAGRPTSVKTRIIARQQQVVRYDREAGQSLRKDVIDRILSYIEEHLASIDALIISDYAKGVVSTRFMDAIRALDVASRIPVVVDPKVRHADLYRQVTMVTPNHHEAARMAGIEIKDESSLIAAGKLLLDRLDCMTVLITRGQDGMSLFTRDGGAEHIPTVARRVFDVTGAGDTVIAAVTLGVAAGLSVVDAARLANLAAGIVVGELGTATVPLDRLLAAIEETS